MIDALRHTTRKAQLRKRPIGAFLSDAERRFIRLGALLHDIGHIAAGHTVEDELGLLGQHDADGRLSRVFEGKDLRDSRHRTLAELVDEQFERYVPESLKKVNVRASIVVRLLIRKPPKLEDPLEAEQAALEKSADIRLDVCRNMIGNTICADLLDYLHRDGYHVGKPREFDERILQYMELRPTRSAEPGRESPPDPGDRFVISLGRRPKIRTDAVSAILELLEWRYQLSESVLFHRTKLAASGMLDRAMFELWDTVGGAASSVIENFLLPFSDEEMLVRCRERAHDVDAAAAEKLFAALERRELFTGLVTKFFDDFQPEVRQAMLDRYYTDPGKPESAAPSNRARVLRVLESDFGLPIGSLAMYCPRPGMNAKLAKVCIAVDEEVLPFDEYEDRHSDRLSGGHLRAQVHRFHRLWRIHFFIDRRVADENKAVVRLLRIAVEKLALGLLADGETPQDAARDLALLLTHVEGSRWSGKTVVARPVLAAYQQTATATGIYPGNVAPIGAFFQD